MAEAILAQVANIMDETRTRIQSHTVGGNRGKNSTVIVFERSLWLLCVFH